MKGKQRREMMRTSADVSLELIHPPTTGSDVAKRSHCVAVLLARRMEPLRMLCGGARKSIFCGPYGKAGRPELASSKRLAAFIVVLAALLFLDAPTHGQSDLGSEHWVGSWAASQQIPEEQNSLAPDEVRDVTIRQIFHLSIGGSWLRVHVSNAFGTEPLHFTSVHIARPASISSPSIAPGSDLPLTFSGAADVTVPAGADYISDPVNYPIAALSSLTVTFHLDAAPAGETGHPGSRATSYYLHGDLVSAADLPSSRRVDHWYQISGIDVETSPGGAAVVALGDSITDGHGATTNGNDRWPDELAARLEASGATREVGVLNQGICGNHRLTDGFGPNALARFDRDVVAQPAVRWVIVLEGINDIGKLAQNVETTAAEHALLVHRMIGAYQQIIARAHAHGLRVIGGTLTPFLGSDYYRPGPPNEGDRQEINNWIRSPGHFDAVVDFDQVVRDPSKPDRLLPAFDSGDHLHPSPAGYRAMAQAIPLSLFIR
jgi:lysophospholipase L1-like esterase